MPEATWDGNIGSTSGPDLSRRVKIDIDVRSFATGESNLTGTNIGVGHGPGVLSGTVTVRGVVQSGAIVLLFDEETEQYVNATTSNASGIYTFTGLPEGRQFFMVFKEPTGLWEYRVSSRRTPVA